MVRIAVCLALVVSACTPAQAPTARRIGTVMSIGSVGGLIGASFFNGADHTGELVLGFSVTSVIGIGLFAAGELTTPAPVRETIPERNHRWARILTERAAGAAREGRCRRVRRLEAKVMVYDREVHDFVFLRDPEILKCVKLPEDSPASAPASEPAPEPAP